MSVKLLLYYINDVKKTHKKTHKTRSYARTFASNIWVLWQPPIGNVTPYFRGLVPYETKEPPKNPQCLSAIKREDKKRELNDSVQLLVDIGAIRDSSATMPEGVPDRTGGKQQR